MTPQRKPHPGPAPAPSAEQLALAYRQLFRPGWPPTVGAALAHPVYGPGLRGLAANLSRAAVCTRPQPKPAPSATTSHTPHWARHGSSFDARRAAANDKDDTE
jgi:hypothetical protein